MKPEDVTDPHGTWRRIKLWSPEIAVAVLLTIVAIAFVAGALWQVDHQPLASAQH
ncbi:MAG TPA: hypothetical protein PK264_07280 [Hyphomicrobiaceae bacterium]|nr:hypothetical protein [Hyphomicrobiaceae bacterium]